MSETTDRATDHSDLPEVNLGGGTTTMSCADLDAPRKVQQKPDYRHGRRDWVRQDHSVRRSIYSLSVQRRLTRPSEFRSLFAIRTYHI